MTVTINDTTMTSDQTAHTARLASGRQHLWEVSWLPGRALDRNSVITAMTLAGHVGEADLDERHRLWPFIENWAAELGLTGSDAISRAISSLAAVASSMTGKVSDPTSRRDNDRPAASAPRPETWIQPARLGTPRSRCRSTTTSPRPPAVPARTRRAGGWPTPSMRPPG